MKKLIPIVAFLTFIASVRAFGQTNGALLPNIPPAFENQNGVAAALGRLCAFAAGTNTPLAIYSDSALTTPLPNPNQLNAIGQPTTNGSTGSAIYIQPRNYKFILYQAGATGAACPLTGTAIWTRDNVYDPALLPSFDNVQLCDRYPGANSAIQIAAAIAALPSTGGRVQCDYKSNQTWPADPFSGVTKPVALLISGAVITQSVAVTVPINVTLQMSQGASVSVNSGITLAINGNIQASRYAIFSGSGTIDLSGSPVADVPVEWFGAATTVANNATAFNTAITSAGNGKTVSCGSGTFTTTAEIAVNREVILQGHNAWWGPSAGRCHIESTNAALAKIISFTSEAGIRDIQISGPGASGTNIGIGIDNSQVFIDRISITGGLTYGVKDNSSAAKSWTYLSNSYISGTDIGWDVVGNQKSSFQNTFFGNRVGLQVGEGGAVTAFTSNKDEFEVNSDQGATARGVLFTDARGWSVSNFYCEVNLAAQVCIAGKTGAAVNIKGGLITGGFLQGGNLGNYAIQPGNATAWDGVAIEGNYFDQWVDGAFNPNGLNTRWGTNWLESTALPDLSGYAKVLIPYGTAAVPGLGFLGEPTTGFIRPGSNEIGFSFTGTERIRLSNGDYRAISSGKIGFSSGAPSAALDTWLDRGAAGLARLFKASGAAILRVVGDGTGTNFIDLTHNNTDGKIETSAGDLVFDPVTDRTRFSAVAFAALGTPANGSFAYCSDCAVTSGADNTCAGSGSGAFAMRLDGVWRCMNAQN